MLISEVAALSGLEPKTIRFYERAKLVTPKRHGRMRIYRAPELDRLRLIKQLRAFDVPIARIRDLLKDQESLSLTGTISSFARNLLAKHLEEMQVRYSQIQEHILELKAVLSKPELVSTTPTDALEPSMIPDMANATS
jgi:DNA-binding transcriptional MerR regulator